MKCLHMNDVHITRATSLGYITWLHQSDVRGHCSQGQWSLFCHISCCLSYIRSLASSSQYMDGVHQPLWTRDGFKSGTVCRPISGCHTASSGTHWRQYYLDFDATAQCELFLTVINRNILTYFTWFTDFAKQGQLQARYEAAVSLQDKTVDCGRFEALRYAIDCCWSLTLIYHTAIIQSCRLTLTGHI